MRWREKVGRGCHERTPLMPLLERRVITPSSLLPGAGKPTTADPLRAPESTLTPSPSGHLRFRASDLSIGLVTSFLTAN